SMTIDIYKNDDIREKGNKLFSENKFIDAISVYKNGLNYSISDKEELSILCSNIATCYAKVNNHQKVIKYATLALQYMPQNQKALYRRSLSYEMINDYMNSFKDMKELLRINPKGNLFNERSKMLFEIVQKANDKKTDHKAIFSQLLDKWLIDKCPDAEKGLIAMASDSSIRNSLFSLENINKMIKSLVIDDYVDSIYKLFHLFIKKSYENTNTLANLIEGENLFPIDSNELSMNAADFISCAIENIINHYTRENVPPLKSESYSVYQLYRNNFLLFLKNNKSICHYFSLIIDQLRKCDQESPSLLHIIQIINKLLGLHEYFSIFALDFQIVNVLLACNIPKHLSSLSYWENYDHHHYLFNLIATCFETIFIHIKSERDLTERFYTQIDKTFEKQLKNNHENDLLFIFLLFPLIRSDQEISSFILLESPFAYGDLLISTFSNALKNLNYETYIAEKHDNFIIFLCEFFIYLQNCSKLFTNTQLKEISKKIIGFAYLRDNKKVQIMAILALTKNESFQNCEINHLCEYYDKIKPVFLKFELDSYDAKAIEVLSFLSLNGDIKEKLINDEILLNSLYKNTVKMCDLIKIAKFDPSKIDNLKYLPVVFCSLSIFANLATIRHPDTISNQIQDNSQNKKDLKKLAMKFGQSIPQKHPKDKKTFVTTRIQKLCTPEFFSFLSNAVNCMKSTQENSFLSKKMLSKYSPYYAASLYYAVLKDTEVRGMAAQNGAIKALLTLSKDLVIGEHMPSSGPGCLEAPYIAAHALSLIAISLNPLVCFNDQTIIQAIQPLVCICDFEQNNLRRFEALLALTNIASANDYVRSHFAQMEKSFQIIESAIFDENALVKRAALELTTNLLMNQLFVERYFMPTEFKSQRTICIEDRDQKAERIRLYVLLAAEYEDVQLSSAALVGLSFMSPYPIICQYIMDIECFPAIINEVLSTNIIELIYRALFLIKNIANHGVGYAEFIKINFQPKILQLDIKSETNEELAEKTNGYRNEINIILDS
ncbi:hypothetical protein HZS_489, partial [Henneguya salminicola]